MSWNAARFLLYWRASGRRIAEGAAAVARVVGVIMTESRVGVLVLGAITVVAMLCLVALSVAHDGTLAQTAAGLFTTIMQTAMGGIAALLSISQVVTGWVNVKTAAAAGGATSAPVPAATVPPVPAGALPTEG